MEVFCPEGRLCSTTAKKLSRSNSARSAAGLHFIAVRATDEDGNIGVEKVSVRVK